MAIQHVVLLKLKPDTPADAKAAIYNGVMSLPKNCVKPDTKQPYILSVKGGKIDMLEGTSFFSRGFTYGFVFEFASKDDLRYYFLEDTVRIEFDTKVVPPHLAAPMEEGGALVFDFVNEQG